MQFQYCPHCGKKAEMREIGDEGVIPYCAQCEVPLWDMFTTSIIAAVVNECGEVALLRQNYVSTTNHVCVAGVMKPGESAEDTVVREVGEELGLDVKVRGCIEPAPGRQCCVAAGSGSDRTITGTDRLLWMRLINSPCRAIDK